MNADGARSIIRYNWPWFAVAMAITLPAVWLLVAWHAPLCLRVMLSVLVGAMDGWLICAIGISYLIYDLRGLARGGWWERAEGRLVIVLHAGHDLASEVVKERLPSAGCRTFDIGPSIAHPSASLRRARRSMPSGESIHAMPLPVDEGAADLVLGVFALHEIRQPSQRVALCREVRRILAPSGRLVLVEHLRDGWNAMAYGPGCLHFLSRRSWVATLQDAGLILHAEAQLTPWVRRFEIGRGP